MLLNLELCHQYSSKYRQSVLDRLFFGGKDHNSYFIDTRFLYVLILLLKAIFTRKLDQEIYTYNSGIERKFLTIKFHVH